MSAVCPWWINAPVPGDTNPDYGAHHCSAGREGHAGDHDCGCGMTWTAAQAEASRKPGAVVTLDATATGYRVHVREAGVAGA